MDGTRVVGVRADVKDGAKGVELRAKVVVDATRPRFAALPQVRLEGQGPRPQQDRGLELLQGRASATPASTKAPRPSPTCRRRDGSGTSRCTRTSSASASSASRATSIATRATRTRSSTARSQACAWIRDHVERRPAVRAGARHRRVLVPLAAHRRRRLLPRRRRVRVPRSAVLDGRVPRAQERRDGRRRHPRRRSRPAARSSAAHFDEYYASQRRAVMSFRQLVRAFYDLSFSFREFLQVYPHLHALIVDTLVGNVFTDLQPLFTGARGIQEASAGSGNRRYDGVDPAYGRFVECASAGQLRSMEAGSLDPACAR